MNICFGLTVFGYHVGALNVRLDLDDMAPIAIAPGKPRLMDSVSDYFASRWFARHS